jgi:hypothetical protein
MSCPRCCNTTSMCAVDTGHVSSQHSACFMPAPITFIGVEKLRWRSGDTRALKGCGTCAGYTMPECACSIFQLHNETGISDAWHHTCIMHAPRSHSTVSYVSLATSVPKSASAPLTAKFCHSGNIHCHLIPAVIVAVMLLTRAIQPWQVGIRPHIVPTNFRHLHPGTLSTLPPCFRCFLFVLRLHICTQSRGRCLSSAGGEAGILRDHGPHHPVLCRLSHVPHLHGQ